jgi:predicted metal-dependent HD superfamily phosphohydrolase
MLKQTFFELIQNYSNDFNLINELWNEIEQNYSSNKRYYHTLNHLENLLNQLLEVKSKIKDWNCILFTLFYHDLIYKATKSDNEEKSADFAVEKMSQLLVSKLVIENCKNQILATKSHLLNIDSDTNYFLDADLSVLGQDWNSYQNYYKNVRKEYSIYPDLLYKPGRKKVLKHFLAMEKIYKTDYFNQKFEMNAKLNLQKELEFL